ncbi:MFS transporter [Streptomyces cinnamoneus]|uniref:MFS transporter n=1 Tax=Streptomyces cinnamoneus TaxID=53446 RepID=A0A918WD07_STRCJ|nr:MFS transporter [Streptomyces cinnamoneus]GHC39238.1 MFS transporter [Streptomyces cinnamoneus]
MTSVSRPPVESAPEASRRHRPGIALLLIATAQIMVVLDATIVNIALPSMQAALDMDTVGLSWVVNAYTLAFGGLLLLGGRTGDVLGRRRVFIAACTLFVLASLLCGLAPSVGWLIAARALQGACAAGISPTALAMISSNFEEGEARNKALGTFAAVSGAGAAVGLLAGGLLTSWLSWRWVFFVNIPIGAAVALLAPLFLRGSAPQRQSFDVAGALTSALGVTALVYGLATTESDTGSSSWAAPVAFVAAAVLLPAFVLLERRRRHPLTPVGLFTVRDRAGALVIMACTGASVIGFFFFLTQFVQEVLEYSALRAGFAFFPVAMAIGIVAQVSSAFIRRTGPRPFLIAGALLSTVSFLWLSQVSLSSGYLTGVFGPGVIFGASMGCLFPPLTVLALSRVPGQDAGAASGVLNVTQQVGGSLGLAGLVAVFTAVTGGVHGPAELVQGMDRVGLVAVALSLTSLVVALFVVTMKPADVDEAALTAL